MIRSIAAAILAAGLFCAGAQAQNLSFDPSAPTQTSGGNPAGTGCGTAVLTQNPNTVPTAANSVSCNDGAAGGFDHTDNSYFRAFNLGSFPQGFTSCAVEFGIEQADAGGVDQPVTVRLYSNTGGVFPAGTRVQVGTATVNVTDQNLTLFSVPLIATVPAGAQLVAEIFTPDGQPASNTFFIGSNATAETAPSYLQAATCGITSPTTTTAIGFPNMHIILNVRGLAAGPAPAPVLTVSPAGGANFSSVTTGQNGTSTVTITNTGNAAATITAISAPLAPFSLVADGCTGQTLAAMTGTCTVTYRFSPIATGPFTQNLTVTSNAPPVTIVLRGVGVAPPVAVPGPGLLALIALGLTLAGFGAWRATRN